MSAPSPVCCWVLRCAALVTLALAAGRAEAQPDDAPVVGDGGVIGDAGASLVRSPPALLADSPAAYPPGLLAQGVAGTVALELTVDAQGEVEDAQVLESPHDALAAAALHAAVALRFAPARLGGEAVPVRLRF